MSETPLESPAEDVAEQREDAFPDEQRADDIRESGLEPSLEADPADSQEQAVEVPLDEDAWP
jgi:hypothetical protein